MQVSHDSRAARRFACTLTCQAFESPKSAAGFAINPILIKWFCNECYHWHAWFKTPAPSGGSSNTSREERIPEHIARLANGE